MRNLFKPVLFIFLAQGIMQTGICQSGNQPVLDGGLKNTMEKLKNAQAVNEAKKKADGAKILILGDSYKLEDAVYLKIAGLGFKEQTDYLKDVLSNNATARKSAIDDAAKEVFGREATPAEFAYQDAKAKEKKDWYATMVLYNTAKLNNNKSDKEIAVQQAFVTVFGRMPTADEQTKWVNGKEHYRIIYQNLLSYMYSADGANDLVETVKRTFTRKKEQPTSDQLKQRMMTAKAQRMDFMKMVSFF